MENGDEIDVVVEQTGGNQFKWTNFLNIILKFFYFKFNEWLICFLFVL